MKGLESVHRGGPASHLHRPDVVDNCDPDRKIPGVRGARQQSNRYDRPLSNRQIKKADKLGVPVNDMRPDEVRDAIAALIEEQRLKSIGNEVVDRVKFLESKSFGEGVKIPQEPFRGSSMYKDMFWVCRGIDDVGNLNLFYVDKDGNERRVQKYKISVFAEELNNIIFEKAL